MAEVDNTSDTRGKLIAASKVNGTSVYNTTGEKLGSVYDVMIDKATGRSEYAIMSFGGFLGMGDHYVDVTPGSVSVAYDPNDKKWKGKINATKDQLKAAPEFKYEGALNH